MASAVLEPVIGAAQSAADKAKAELEEFSRDPVYVSGIKCRKWGFITLAGGIASFILLQVGKQLDQSYLNDIDQVLGVPSEMKPTSTPPAQPVAPPPLPPIVQYMNAAIGDLNSISTTNANAAITQLQAVISDLFSIRDQIYQPSGGFPTQLGPVVSGVSAGGNLVNALIQTADAIFALRGLTGNIPITNLQIGGLTEQESIYYLYQAYIFEYEQNPEANVFPSGISPGMVESFWGAVNAALTPYTPTGAPASDWNTAFQMIGTSTTGPNTKSSVNALCSVIGMTQAFDLTTPSNNPWGPFGGFVTFFLDVQVSVVQDLTNFGNDVKGFASDVGAGLAFIGKAILNFPRLTFDAMGYALWWMVDQVSGIIWLPLIIIGSALLAWSIFALNIYPKFKRRLKVYAKARTARLWNWIDEKLKTREKVKAIFKQEKTEKMIEAASQTPEYVPTPVQLPAPGASPPPPVIEAVPPAEAEGTKPEEQGGAVTIAPVVTVPPEREGEAQLELAKVPAEGAPPPPLAVASTQETEEMLGEAPNLREQRMSLETQGTPFVGQKSDTPEAPGTTFAPPAVSEPVPVAVPQPTYRERLQERRRRRSRQVLAELNGAFAPVAA